MRTAAHNIKHPRDGSAIPGGVVCELLEVQDRRLGDRLLPPALLIQYAESYAAPRAPMAQGPYCETLYRAKIKFASFFFSYYALSYDHMGG